MKYTTNNANQNKTNKRKNTQHLTGPYPRVAQGAAQRTTNARRQGEGTYAMRTYANRMSAWSTNTRKRSNQKDDEGWGAWRRRTADRLERLWCSPTTYITNLTNITNINQCGRQDQRRRKRPIDDDLRLQKPCFGRCEETPDGRS